MLDRGSRVRGFVLAAMLMAVPLSMGRASAGDPPPKPKRPDIYDRQADGNKQISEALQVARRENKTVLLMFGANWCSWCHRLHGLFESDRDVARKLLYEYELVLIDVDTIDGKKHNVDVDQRYGSPTKQGLPVLVFLDADGKQRHTQETEALEVGDGHDPKKVLALLEKWQPKPQSADRILSAGLSRARSEEKKVFVYFSAPWCGWCHRFDAYLRRPEIAEVFTRAFVPIKIDVDRMTHGKDLDKKYRGAPDGGIPFFAILDAHGAKLADSMAKEGNVGCPVEPAEIAHFMKVVRTHGTGLTEEQLSVLEKGLAEKPK